MSARSKIDVLASNIADVASREDVKLTDKVEALKALTGYLSALERGGKRRALTPPADGADFDSFRLAASEDSEDGREDGGRSSRVSTGRRERVRDLRAGGEN